MAIRCELFETALGAALQGPCSTLAELLAPLRSEMFWTDYLPNPWANPFRRHMATATLVGRRGPIDDDEIAFGVFAVAPDTQYPEHGHRASEVYLTIAGDPLFLGESGWVALDPGRATLQRPDVVHALRTRATAALFSWAWSGEVDSRIWALDDNGERFYPPNLRTEAV